MRSLVKIPKELSAGTFLCHLAHLFAVTIDAPQIHKIAQVSEAIDLPAGLEQSFAARRGKRSCRQGAKLCLDLGIAHGSLG